MSRILLICVSFLLLNKVNAQGNCELGQVTEDEWETRYTNVPIPDTEETEFKLFTIQDIQAVTLNGADFGKYFTHELNIDDGYLRIIPSPEFRNYEQNEPSSTDTPQIFVYLEFVCTTGTRRLAFYQPITDVNTDPEFSMNPYQLLLPMPLPADLDITLFGADILARDNDITNTRLDFEIVPDGDFAITYGGPTDSSNKNHRAVIRTINPLRLLDSKDYTLTVIDMQGARSTAQLNIEIDPDNTLPPNPYFMDIHYTAQYTVDDDDNHELTLDRTITLDQAYAPEDLTIQLIGDHSEIFEYSAGSDGTIAITLGTGNKLGQDVLENQPVLILTLQANIPIADGPAKTAIIIYLPKMECTQEPPPIVTMEKDSHSYEISTWQEGCFGQIRATAKPEEEIRYYLEDSAGGTPPTQLNLNPATGELCVTERMSSGTHYLIAFAEGITSQAKAQALVAVNIIRDTNINTVNSIMVEHVPENTAVEIPFPCYSQDPTDCKYSLVEFHPPVNPVPFQVTDNSLVITALDREMNEISALPFPQFTLILQLEENNARIRSNASLVPLFKTRADSVDWVYLPNPLPQKLDQLVLTVIIDDENDNDPQFDVGTALVVGYPVKELLEEIAPPYLAKVAATDRDAGENAAITYSTSSVYFKINSQTGVIYPGEGAFDSAANLAFTVTATDRSGAGNPTNLDVSVKLLLEENLVVLSATNLQLEDVENTLRQLSQQISVTVKHLTASAIVANEPSTTNPRAISDHYARIIIYGLNAANEPLLNDELRVAIENSPVPNIVVENWESAYKEPPIISFDQEHYTFQVEYLQTGRVGEVQATITPAEGIEYSLEMPGGDPLPAEIALDPSTGELRLLALLSSGNYYLIARVKGIDSQVTAHATIALEVQEEELVHTEYSVLVERINEHQGTEFTLPCSTGTATDCEYTILEQYPETTPRLFSVSPASSLIVSAIDREMDAIVGFPTPQFTLRLGLGQGSNGRHFNRTGHRISKRDLRLDNPEFAFIPSQISNSGNELIVSVIINDINDHPPAFDVGSSLVVGFPVKDLVEDVAPTYLTKVSATDADSGENAEILFSTTSPHFKINDKTGVIYPGEGGLEVETNLAFVVSATDQNGNGLSAQLNVQVVLLEEGQLSVLKVKNLPLEDVESTLSGLSQQTRIGYLTASAIVLADGTPAVNGDYFTRLIIYGLNNQNQPISNDELQQIIGGSTLTDYVLEDWQASDSEPTVTFEKDNYSFELSTWHTGFLEFVRATTNTDEAITYSIDGDEGATVPAEIQYDENTGELSLNGNLNAGIYNLIASAVGADSGVEAEVAVSIRVTENPDPLIIFERENYVLELTPWQTGFLIFIKATANPAETLLYTIQPVEGQTLPQELDYNANTGALSLTSNLNSGTYNLIAEAEGVDSSVRAVVSVSITVTAIDDPIIIFERESYSFEIYSWKTGFLAYIKAVASNKEPLAYSIETLGGETVPTALQYNPNTGELVIIENLEPGTYNLIATATGIDSNIEADAMVAIRVTNSEDPVIIFERDNYSLEINPWQTGLLVTVKATASSGEQITYSISAIEGETLPQEITFDENTGELSLRLNLNPGIYNLIVTATGDDTAVTSEVTVAIRVDDNEDPIIVFERENYSFEINSWQTGLLGTIKAVASPNEPISYSIEPAEGTLPEEIDFNTNTGELSLTSNLNAGTYNLIVVASGSVSNVRAQSTVAIRVSETEDPVIVFERENYGFEIYSWKIGFLAFVKAVSSNREQLEYSMEAVEGETVPTALQYDQTTGELVINENLDPGTYNLIVTARGIVSNIEAQANIAIRVTNSEDPVIIFERDNYSLEINPWQTGLLVTVRATASSAELITYSISASEGQTLPQEIDFDTNTGELSLILNLNPGIYNLIVTAAGVDSGVTAQVTVAIRVDDNADPIIVFERENYSVEISSWQTGLLGTIKAVASPNEPISYSIEPAEGTLPEEIDFNINTGELSLTSNLNAGTYNLIVVALGSVSNVRAQTTVAIRVSETEDPVIVFERENYGFEIYSWKIGFLAFLKAVSSNREQLEYSIEALEGETLPTALQYDANTGELVINENLGPGTYDLIVTARGIVSNIEAHANVAIRVTNSEDPIIIFERETYSLEINSWQTGLLITIKGTASSGEQITYSVRAGEGQTLPAEIELAANGDLSLRENLNAGIYYLIITATGVDSSVTAEATVAIRVSEIEGPLILFERENYSLDINPWQTGLLVTVKATASSGEQITYSINAAEGQDVPEEIDFNVNTGELSLILNLNPGIYNLIVTAAGVDSGVNAQVTVAIRVDNNADPIIVFERENYSFEISSWQTGLLGTIRAIATPNELISYSIEPAEGGTVPEEIDFNANTGELSLTSNLNSGTYNVIVIAVGTVSSVRAEASVAIRVSEIEDPVIVFEKENYSFEIYSWKTGFLAFVKAVSSDREQLEYSIEAQEGETVPTALQYDQNTGELTINENLDPGTYNLIVTARGIVSNIEAHANVAIRVTNSADPIIIFERETYSLEINSWQTGLLITIKGTASSGEPIMYSVRAGEGQTLPPEVELAANGDLSLRENLNAGIYYLIITATGVDSSVTAEATVAIRVSEIEGPLILFERENYSLDINPWQTGLLVTVKATVSSGELITYSISAAEGQDVPQEIDFNVNTGELSLILNLNPGIYNLIVTAAGVDSGVTAQVTVAIRVDDNEDPIIVFERENYSLEISSWQTGLLGTIKAVASPNEPISYSIEPAEGTLPEEIDFNINTGELSLTSNLNAGTYNLIVVASGSVSNVRAQTTVAIRVRETEDPVIVFERENYGFEIYSWKIGFLAFVKAVSSNREQLEYSMEAVEGETVPTALQYDPNTGELVINENLDPGTYNLIVTARGIVSNIEAQANIAIRVTNSEDPVIIFERDNYSLEINPWQTGLLVTVRATASSAELITYSISPTEGQTLPQEIDFDTNTGELSLTLNLNPGIYNLIVTAAGVDSGVTAQVIVAIRVDDNADPIIVFERENYSLEISSWQTGLLGTIKAVASPNEPISYSIEPAEGTLPEEIDFNTNTGELSLTSNLNAGTYNLIVVALGSVSNVRAQTTVAIRVSETEDPVIVFERENYGFEIYSWKIGFLAFVKAVSSNREQLEYSIEALGGETVPTALQYDTNTGELVINENLDPGTYNLIVTARGIVSNIEAQANVAIRVTNSDDPIIIFERETYSLEINSWQTGLLINIKGTASSGEPITYSVRAGEGQTLPTEIEFDANGDLSLRESLNAGIYYLIVTATGVDSSVTAEATVAIRVSDNEDPTILFERENYSLEINPWQTGLLLVVKATSNSGEQIQYSIREAEGAVLPPELEFDQITGELSLVENLNPGIYNLIVSAEGSESNYIAEATIAIRVSDIEDPVILFERENYSFEINSWQIGLLGTIKAIASTKEELVYSILAEEGTTLPSELSFNPGTGELSLTENLSPGIYNLIAQADGVQSEITAIAAVAIRVKESEDPIILFEREHYSFEIEPWQTVFSALIKATISTKEPIVYSIIPVEGGTLPPELEYDENTGELQLNGNLNVGIYNMIAHAVGVTSNANTQTDVAIRVSDDSGETQTIYSVIVEHVTENEGNSIELPCSVDDDCNYRIIEVYPETTLGLFEISFGNVLTVGQIDRETPEIVGMVVPQFSLALQLDNNPGRRNRNKTIHSIRKAEAFVEGDREFALIPNQISNTNDQISVSIIIDDVNDNPPSFDQGTQLVIGYPAKELLESVRPTYLTKVSATDQDVGENSEISYSTSSAFFKVHEKTGVVYAGEGSLDNDLNLLFTVTATDRNGAGLNSDLSVQVKLLSEEHLLTLTVTNLLLEEIEQELAELSQQVKVGYLAVSFAVPVSEEGVRVRNSSADIRSKRATRAASDHSTRLIVYGLNNNNNEPVLNDDLQQIILDSETLGDFTVEKWERDCTEPTEPSIIFERPNYNIEMNTWQVGFVASITATANPEETLMYTLEPQQGSSVPTGLTYNVDTGALGTDDELLEGIYYLTTIAEGVDSARTGQATVALRVIDESEDQLQITRALLVQHVAENSNAQIELPCSADVPTDCVYTIIDQYPTTTDVLFNAVPGSLTIPTGIDRERDEIVGLTVPQFTLRLRLERNPAMGRSNRTSHAISKRHTRADEATEFALVPSEIPYSNDLLLVSIIIDDVNDNPPVFDVGSRLVVGYPVQDLVRELAPPYLAKVTATDRDVGQNAEISYTTNSQYFKVHAKTGIIYPGEGAFDNSANLVFSVTAMDLNGVGGETADLEIEVKPLDQGHLTVLTVKNLLLEDVESKLNDLSTETNLQIKHLTAVAIPSSASTYNPISARNRTKKSPRAVSDHDVRIIIYALNAQEDLIENEELQSAVESSQTFEEFTVDGWEPTCDTEPPETTIIFEREAYSLQINTWQTGFLLNIRAHADPHEGLIYSLQPRQGETIPSQISFNVVTGALSLTDALDSGIYSFIVIAEGETSQVTAEASVTINVDDEAGGAQTMYSVLVAHVNENTASTNIEIPCVAEDPSSCQYEIIEQYPPSPVMFSVSGNYLVLATSIDREMSEIVNMPVPQFTVSLVLQGSERSWNRNSSIDLRRNTYADETREWAYIPSPMQNLRDRMFVSVIIDDLNDNPPVFDVGARIVVGYPTKELVNDLAPPYLTKVQATDLDAGENAEIQYTTNSGYFVIHPKTGVIYAGEGSLDAQTNLVFTVTATDRNGVGGLSTPLEIEVKLLDQVHLVVLSVRNLLLEDVDQRLQEYSEQTGLNIKYLTASTIGVTETSRNAKKSAWAASDLYTKIVVYGLDAQDVPVGNEDLQGALEDSVTSEGLVIDTWEPPSGGGDGCDGGNGENGGNGGDCSDECDTGLIVAVSVLGALLIIFIIAALLFYYLKFYRTRKPKPYSEMEDDTSSTNSSTSNDSKKDKTRKSDISTRRPTGFVFNPPPIEEDTADLEKDKPKYIEIPEYAPSSSVMSDVTYDVYDGKRDGHTYEKLGKKPEWNRDEDEDEFGERKVRVAEKPTEIVSDKVFENKPEDDYDTYGKAKSVTFKETVQKINILVDDKPDDDDDVLDVRL